MYHQFPNKHTNDITGWVLPRGQGQDLYSHMGPFSLFVFFCFQSALLPRGVSLALRGLPRPGATWQCLGTPGVVYPRPPETPAASFPHKSLLFSLLPALSFCLFTEADIQQTQPRHRRDLDGESRTSLSVTWLGLHTWGSSGVSGPSPEGKEIYHLQKQGQPVEGRLSGSLPQPL